MPDLSKFDAISPFLCLQVVFLGYFRVDWRTLGMIGIVACVIVHWQPIARMRFGLEQNEKIFN